VAIRIARAGPSESGLPPRGVLAGLPSVTLAGTISCSAQGACEVVALRGGVDRLRAMSVIYDLLEAREMAGQIAGLNRRA